MLNFFLRVNNPFKKDTHSNFHHLWGWHKSLTQYREFEIETYYSPMIVDVEIVFEMKGRDHAGPRITIGILGWTISASIYDNRHWDYDAGYWEQDVVGDDGTAPPS